LALWMLPTAKAPGLFCSTISWLGKLPAIREAPPITNHPFDALTACSWQAFHLSPFYLRVNRASPKSACF
jgi:hypothetical protein